MNKLSDKPIEYIKYQNYLGELPSVFDKYLTLDFMERLKDISLLCGMEYASDKTYDFKFYISRYDHSVNVCKLVYRLTNNIEASLAGLFHDVASPAFSHVIDYYNHDYINQESTERFTEDILRNSSALKKYLLEDGIDIEDIIDFKKYSVVDLPRPSLCADRLENIISVGFNWIDKMSFNAAKNIIDNLTLKENEIGESEIVINNKNYAGYVVLVNDYINEYTHTDMDNYMMNLLASIIGCAINIGLFSYYDLYHLTESEVVEIIEDNLDYSSLLKEKWMLFRNIDKNDIDEQSEIVTKDKVVDPLINNKRFSRFKKIWYNTK